ncbi:MAG: hypothetical protein K2Q03_04490 [Sphingobacteriaceae bacterium]|nr:hypothetical protein [Sphingobacteriaceae bacterium]
MYRQLVAFILISLFYTASHAQEKGGTAKKMPNEWVAKKTALELQKKLNLSEEQTAFVEQIELAKLILADQWAAFDKAEILAAIEARKVKLSNRENAKKLLTDSLFSVLTPDQIDKLNDLKELQLKEEAAEKQRQIMKALEYQNNRRKQNEEKKELMQLMPISIPKPKNPGTGN